MIYLYTFLISFVMLFSIRMIANKIGLVDIPNERKLHCDTVPLTGGISIFISLIIALVNFFPSNFIFSFKIYLLCSFSLIILGVLDDYYDINFKVRLLIQGIISFIMIFQGGDSIQYLGFLIGGDVIVLNKFVSYVITVIAVIGSINAFNMVDGIDGLLGGLASVTFTALGVVFFNSDNEYLGAICILIVTVLAPYILLNLGFPLGRRFKIFMGDAGSMFIGFSVIWMLIRGTQEPSIVAFRPVTALWLVALPLMDMVTTITRRMYKGHSPFKPDREHLHHICLRIGLSPLLTLFLICFMASACAIVGIYSDIYGVAESTMFIAFLCLFFVYFTVINYIFSIIFFINKLLGITI